MAKTFRPLILVLQAITTQFRIPNIINCTMCHTVSPKKKGDNHRKNESQQQANTRDCLTCDATTTFGPSKNCMLQIQHNHDNYSKSTNRGSQTSSKFWVAWPLSDTICYNCWMKKLFFLDNIWRVALFRAVVSSTKTLTQQPTPPFPSRFSAY